MNIVTKRQLAILAQAKALSLKSQFIFVCFLNGKKQNPKEKTSKKLFVLFKLQLLLVLLVILTQSILAKKIEVMQKSKFLSTQQRCQNDEKEQSFQ